MLLKIKRFVTPRPPLHAALILQSRFLLLKRYVPTEQKAFHRGHVFRNKPIQHVKHLR